MMVKDFHGIEELVKSRITEPKRVMVIGNCFWRWMLALKKAADLGLVRPVLIGSEKSIRENAEIHNVDISSFDIQNVQGDVVEPAVAAMKSDGVDVIVRGDVGVLDMLSALFVRECGFRIGKKHVSGVSDRLEGRFS
jgi:hypothetical protein